MRNVANENALQYARGAAILEKMYKRQHYGSAKGDALWDGYWLVKEKRDYWRERVAEETAPWFDGSAFPKSNRASDLGLSAGDWCPKCDGELHLVKHEFQTDGGAPDCCWLACLDCNYTTDPE